MKEMPEEWKESIIVPADKKGDKTDCSNYRGISLMSATYVGWNFSSGNCCRDAMQRNQIMSLIPHVSYIPTLPQSKWTLPSHITRMRSDEKNRTSC